MNMTEMKPLKPLDHGNVLIVGTKASNFDEEMRTHPRVIMWDSQNEKWTSRDIPQNVQAIFITKWIGHSDFNRILKEARKKHITIFNPQGTGIIARQVKELLTPTVPKVFTTPVTRTPTSIVESVTRVIQLPTTVKETIVMPARKGDYKRHKLVPLYDMIDFSKTNKENADAMMVKAKELGITTTMGSLEQLMVFRRRKLAPQSTPKTPIIKAQTVDVSIQLFDEMVKNFQDLRALFVATVNENITLKAKMQNFKKLMEL